jgi:RNA polymerase primary sigma factor
MSLEAALAELTKEMKRNNELLEKNIETRSALVAKVEKQSKSDKSEAAAPAKKVEKTEKPAKASKSEKIDDKTIRKAFGEFMDVESEKVRDKRKAFVAALLDEFGADTVVDIQPEDRARAMSLLEKKLNGEEVNFGEDEDDEDEDDDSSDDDDDEEDDE